MKKVLIIGYFRPFFPFGSGRVPLLAKYLSDFGWHPLILTPLKTTPPANSRFTILETPYPGDVFSFWRRMFGKFGFETTKSITEQIKFKTGIVSENSFIEKSRTIYQEFFAFPDTEKRWLKSALKTARQFLAKERVDAILSIWPVTSHLVAKKLKEEYEIPWIADFPDPWTENHDYSYGRIRKYFDRKLEMKTIVSANALTAAAPICAERASRTNNKPAEILFHGFDPEVVNKPPAPLLPGKFTITYTGTLYRKHSPEKILLAIHNLLSTRKIKKDTFELRFFGPKYAYLEKLINDFNLQDVVKQYGIVPREEILKHQRESQILLIFGWQDKKDWGTMPYKTYEYLAARRPILVSSGYKGDYITKVIEETKTGVHAPDVKSLAKTILKYYKEYNQNGSVRYLGDNNLIDNYSSIKTAAGFAKALDKISQSGKNSQRNVR